MLRLVLVILSHWIIATNADGTDHWIIGGEEVNITNVPYMASLRRYGRHHCGAAILNDRWAATAAHCFYRFQTDIFTLYTGSSDIYSGGLIHELEFFIFHEEYSPITLNNDIAMVKVQNIINFDRTTLPVPLPDINFIMNTGDKAKVTGWGYTSESGPLSITLLEVDLLIVSKTKCSESYRKIRNITDAMFCAGFDEGEKDSCQGDSGGPLVSKGVLVGIVSWGRGCGRPDLPGVYAKVSHFDDWISQQMGTISTFK